MFKYYLYAFLISMVPLIELRGAIPFAVGWGIMTNGDVKSIITCFLVCIIGNMVPVPFIYLFARRVLEWGQEKKLIGGICRFFLTKGTSAGQKLQEKAGRGIFAALLLFVGIPLPGTGAWTGTLAASLLDMKFKDTVIAVMLGVVLAGLIMMAGSLGVFSAIAAVFAK